MIDIHCHILPGMDDGSKSWPQTLLMAKNAVKQGITHIIATPHHNNGAYVNLKEDIIGAVDYVNGQLRREGIPLTLLPGQEIRIYGDMVEDLKDGDLLPLNVTSNYIFVELPNDHVPHHFPQLQFDLQISGYVPIIVHPERNEEIMANPEILYRFVSNGALTQVTAASVVGKLGKKTQRFTSQLIDHQLTHFIASDAHDPKKRTFFLAEAYKAIDKQFGKEKVQALKQNSEAIIDDISIVMDPPRHIRERKLFRW